ncbi:MAG TPA: hypothetical protein PLZ38_10780 [Spirochaetota bacterium]|nr:hypothetical protein [Spirochaetota bacterium]HOR94447.1 hypothetical protein [Spirochaetota bacterium]HPK44714.1 hypothetical protein [Spirochaetota bacterium]
MQGDSSGIGWQVTRVYQKCNKVYCHPRSLMWTVKYEDTLFGCVAVA